MGLTAEKTSIVASLAPATGEEARAAAAEVPASVAFVEIRLDGFVDARDLAGLRNAYEGKTLLATLRSAAQGGRFVGGVLEARELLAGALDAGFDLVDIELAMGRDLLGFDPDRVVVSHHDLAGVPPDLDFLASEMAATNARYAKIVGTARDSRDALRLLAFQRRRADGRLSAFAMGEAGLATRILSPYLGAPLAYGALKKGRETASTQPLARDLHEVYGIGKRREVDKLYALFGGFVSHSLSPAIHNANFEALSDGALYVPFALASMLTEFDPLVVAFDGLGLPLKGASITIPFKEEAATVAVFRGESVANTLIRRGETFVASNTDRLAFAHFTPLAPGARALVLGAGGTARVAVDVLISRRYDVFVWNRNPVRAHELCEDTGASFVANLTAKEGPFGLLVNATPVGMKPDDPLPCGEWLLHEGLVVLDAPYGANETRLVRAARKHGARVVDGHALLLAQAVKQAELFTGKETSIEELRNRLPSRLRDAFEVNA